MSLPSLTSLFADWLDDVQSDPWLIVGPLVLTILVAALYVRGMRYEARTGIGRQVSVFQALSFFVGMLVLLLAIASPLDTLADESLAAHMVQHEILVLVVPPLLLLGTPLWPLWRALPLHWRRGSLRWLLRRHRIMRVAYTAQRVVFRPLGAWCLFIVIFVGWHIPALYDLALENEAVHALEHTMFLGAALIFWAQVIPSFPLQPSLTFLRRAGYLFGAALVLHLLSVLIDIAVQPIYSFYGVGPNVVANQAAGGAIMDVSGQVVFTTAILICLGLWLRDDERKEALQAEGMPSETQANISARGALLIAEADLSESSEQASRK
jgi:cytochrome c oxidase assembly factor CtaG